ncbi:Wzz/FepE/Etk N-terminal domain-containing protein [Methylobacterium mesophilicum]
MASDFIQGGTGVIDRHLLSDSSELTFTKFIIYLRRNLIYIVGWVGFTTLLALCIALSTSAEYTSTALILIEPQRNMVSVNSRDADGPAATLDASQIESEIQLVKSDQVLKLVFDELHLDDAETKKKPGLLSYFIRSIEGKSRNQPDDEQDVDLRDSLRRYKSFSDRVSVRRVGQSYVLEITYRSNDPKSATKIANSIAASFILDKINSRWLIAQRAGDWLQSRVDEIKKQKDAALESVRSGEKIVARFSASDARAISAATLPPGKSSPKTLLLCALGLFVGLFTACIAIAIGLKIDNKVWGEADARHACQFGEYVDFRWQDKSEKIYKPQESNKIFSMALKNGPMPNSAVELASALYRGKLKNGPTIVAIQALYSGANADFISLASAYNLDKLGLSIIKFKVALKDSSSYIGNTSPKIQNVSRINVPTPGGNFFWAGHLQNDGIGTSYMFETVPDLIETIESMAEFDFILLDLPPLGGQGASKFIYNLVDYVILVGAAGLLNINQLSKARKFVGHIDNSKVFLVLNKSKYIKD